MLKASDLRCAHGDNTIFDGLSLTLSGTRRVGARRPERGRQDDAAAHAGGRRRS